MNEDNNIQKNFEKKQNKRTNLFMDLVCDNHMNTIMFVDTKAQLLKAHIEGNEVMKILLSEQADVYLGTINNNITELQYLMEELGFNDIDFNLN